MVDYATLVDQVQRYSVMHWQLRKVEAWPVKESGLSVIERVACMIG